MILAPALQSSRIIPQRRLLFIGAGTIAAVADGDIHLALPFAELDGTVLHGFNPDLVTFRLISRDLDATVVIEQLIALGYRGQCMVLAPGLPNPRAVEAELREVAKGMQVTLLSDVTSG